MTDRALMQQALADLEYFAQQGYDCFDSITALRACLAEPQTVNEAYEACELLKRMGFKWYELEESWYPSAPAKPEPEPVAWLLDEGDGSGKYLTFGKPEHYKGTPLYTAPPARAALKEAK